MLGSLRVKPESSYQQPIDPPQDLIAPPPRQEKRRDLEGRGVVYLKMILLFFFLQGEASDVTIQKEEVNPSCDIVMASSGGSHG